MCGQLTVDLGVMFSTDIVGERGKEIESERKCRRVNEKK